MNAPPLSYAALDWDAQGQPFSRVFADRYFSAQDGLGETQTVFLHGNDLPARWQTAATQRPFVIAEMGFGTGLNFLLTAQQFLQHAPAALRLHFLSIEAYPLTPSDLAKALNQWSSLQALGAALHRQYPPLVPGCHRLMFAQGRVLLDLWLGMAEVVLPQWVDDPEGLVDAWYLDGFAPRKNPRLWQPALYQQMARLSRIGASFSTFTAAGQVRRDLQAAGFVVSKRPGFGNKREHLVGIFPPSAPRPRLHTPPWFRRPLQARAPGTALIIGAGLAGTAAAYSLARRGWECSLIDQAPQLAAGASGNRQGIFYPPVSNAWRDAASQFFLHAWLYALRHLDTLFAAGFGFAQDRCGVLLSKDPIGLRKLFEKQSFTAEIAEWWKAEEVAQRTGQQAQQAGLWFPQAGWLSPPELCQAQWQAAGAFGIHHLHLNQAVTRLQRSAGQWQLYQGQTLIASGDLLIIANAYGAQRLLPNVPLAQQLVRGQVSYLPATPASLVLCTVLCSNGYVTPAWQGQHCIGATYDREHLEPGSRAEDNRLNFQQLMEDFPKLANTLATTTAYPASAPARSSLRCASRDHLPLLGNLPNYSAFMQQYKDLHLGKRFSEYPTRPPFEDLYVSIGHGSRGLISTALGAEILAAQIHAEPFPVSLEMLQAIAAQRFWVRSLK